AVQAAKAHDGKRHKPQFFWFEYQIRQSAIAVSIDLSRFRLRAVATLLNKIRKIEIVRSQSVTDRLAVIQHNRFDRNTEPAQLRLVTFEHPSTSGRSCDRLCVGRHIFE